MEVSEHDKYLGALDAGSPSLYIQGDPLLQRATGSKHAQGAGGGDGIHPAAAGAALFGGSLATQVDEGSVAKVSQEGGASF